MRKTLYILFITALTSNASSQTVGESAGNFLGSQVVSFLDSIVVSNINSWPDFVAFILLPLLGLYAISRFLAYHAFLLAEENFHDNTGIEKGDSISDGGRMASNLIGVTVGAVGTMFYGGFSLVVVTALGLIGVIWFLWQFWAGAAKSAWTPEAVDERLGSMENREEQAEEMEELLEDGGFTDGRPEPREVKNSGDELEKVAETLRREERDLRQAVSIEEEELETAISDTRRYLELKRVEKEAVEKMVKTSREAQEFLEDTTGFSPEEAERYAETFREFWEHSGSGLWKKWTASDEREKAIKQGGKSSAIDTGKDFPGEMTENIHRLKGLLDRIEEMESERNIRGIRDELRRVMRQERKSLKHLRRLKEELEKAFNQEEKLEKVVNSLEDPGLRGDIRQDRGELEEVRKTLKAIGRSENDLLTLENRIEEAKQDIIDLESQKDLKEVSREVSRGTGSILVLRDLYLDRGLMKEGGKLQDRLEKYVEIFARSWIILEKIERERQESGEMEQFLEELEKTTQEMIGILVDKSS